MSCCDIAKWPHRLNMNMNMKNDLVMLMESPAFGLGCASTFDLSSCVLSQFDRDACQQSVCTWRAAASLEGQQTVTGKLVVTLSCFTGT